MACAPCSTRCATRPTKPHRDGAETTSESIMKIHQLPIGARFEYDGQEYVKTGPLFGTGPAGQRLIPKYAVLRPLDGVAAPPEAQRSETVLRADVVTGFDTFYAQCKTLVPEDRRGALETARDSFLQTLDSLST